MRLSAHPLTLNAFLWLAIFKLDGAPHEWACTFCNQRFEVPVKRGRPYSYCPDHRAPRFKKMFERGTAGRWLDQNRPVTGSS